MHQAFANGCDVVGVTPAAGLSRVAEVARKSGHLGVRAVLCSVLVIASVTNCAIIGRECMSRCKPRASVGMALNAGIPGVCMGRASSYVPPGNEQKGRGDKDEGGSEIHMLIVILLMPLRYSIAMIGANL
jgi:hypothetical protein